MPASASSHFILNGFFCFSLHTGSVLLGWLGFISAFFSIIGWSLSFNNIDGIIQSLNVTDKTPDAWSPEDIAFMHNAAIFIISMLIGFYVIEALASIFLVYGAAYNERMFLVPWLVERTIQLCFYTVIWLFIGLYLFTSSQTVGYSIYSVIFGGIALFFNFYCFMCVYSLFVLMREAQEYQRLTVHHAHVSPPPNYTQLNRSSGTTYVKI
ncbi:hypothetical protein PVAND_007275 [Polypedilum vanderplanki]|uniref:Uncharacterized protein n=1 Tax=Polypedilum vanderplanki TaxID=319348 RepID=A0A9J6C6P0_POLVA|nr:hypothetical protein PVAND_007275 [Polypedilum vanderplanki]